MLQSTHFPTADGRTRQAYTICSPAHDSMNGNAVFHAKSVVLNRFCIFPLPKRVDRSRKTD